MLRAILKTRCRDSVTGAETFRLWTLDFSCPDLEEVLTQGGFSESGYRFTELVGLEPRPGETPDGQAEKSGLPSSLDNPTHDT